MDVYYGRHRRFRFYFEGRMSFNQLTGLYPIVASVTALVCIAPLVATMVLQRRRPGIAFYDAEHGSDGKSSAEFYLALLLGMLLLSAVTGFVLGIAIFIFCFLLLRGELSPLKSMFGAAGFVLFLGVLSDQLTLRYPTGLLQNWITLPWPLQ